MSEKEVVGKVEELMKALDQVKKYKVLAQLLGDFVIILLLSFVALFSLALVVNFTYLVNISGSYFSYPEMNLVTRSFGVMYGDSLPTFVVIAAVVLIGVFWVDRKLKRVKIEEWRGTLNEGFLGALKLLQGLNWDNVFDDIRSSKIAYTVYAIIKVVSYWILIMAALFLPYSIGLSIIHVSANLYFLALISLTLVVIFSKKDLQKKYRQVTSLDKLLWELGGLIVNSVQPNSKPDLYVVARIISALKEKSGVKRTELATYRMRRPFWLLDSRSMLTG